MCLSLLACSEPQAVGGFPTATAAPRRDAEPGACIRRSRLRAVRVAIRHAHCDQVRVEHLNLDTEFLQPPPVQTQGVGANPVTRQHRKRLDDLSGGLGNTPERPSNTKGCNIARR
jgi:hypothetical protein